MLYKSEDRITKQCVVTESPRTQTVLLVIVKMAQGSESGETEHSRTVTFTGGFISWVSCFPFLTLETHKYTHLSDIF